MRGSTVVLCVAGVFAFSAALADTVQFPLPSTLHVTYLCEPWVSQSAEFVVRPRPAVVRSVSIKLSGQTIVRQWYCDLDPPFDLPVKLVAFIPDPVTGGGWVATGTAALQTGPFDVTLPLRPYWPAHYGQPTWDSLREGSATIELNGSGAPIIDICWPIGDLSEATVTRASLVIEGDFPIPVEPTTWGCVKALFGE